MIGEPEVVVGAEVDHLAAAFERDHGALRGADDEFTLQEAVSIERLALNAQCV
jgi:hypothetical protein